MENIIVLLLVLYYFSFFYISVYHGFSNDLLVPFSLNSSIKRSLNAANRLPMEIHLKLPMIKVLFVFFAYSLNLTISLVSWSRILLRI